MSTSTQLQCGGRTCAQCGKCCDWVPTYCTNYKRRDDGTCTDNTDTLYEVLFRTALAVSDARLSARISQRISRDHAANRCRRAVDDLDAALNTTIRAGDLLEIVIDAFTCAKMIAFDVDRARDGDGLAILEASKAVRRAQHDHVCQCVDSHQPSYSTASLAAVPENTVMASTSSPTPQPTPEKEVQEFAAPGVCERLFCEGRPCSKCHKCRDWHFNGDHDTWNWVFNWRNWVKADEDRWCNNRAKLLTKRDDATCRIICYGNDYRRVGDSNCYYGHDSYYDSDGTYHSGMLYGGGRSGFIYIDHLCSCEKHSH
ncbi:unnamed protein product [Adineta steineri]|uniref:Uncharacterized protein n=1 Tax=Adineta steineri TaxID=433720 RepID=A0A813V5D1_9BILA|nr:unnamed protein product [Adineta steineri]CAF3879348.1 unnamed protein product [Adineta steineri]